MTENIETLYWPRILNTEGETLFIKGFKTFDSDKDWGKFLLEALEAGVSLEHADLSDRVIRDISLRGESLKYANLKNTRFYDCDLSNMDISEANIDRLYIDWFHNITTGIVLPARLIPRQGEFTLYKVVGIYHSDRAKYNLEERFAILELRVPTDAERVVAQDDPPRYRVSKALPIRLFDLLGSLLPEGIEKVYPPVYTNCLDYYIGHMYEVNKIDKDIWDGCSYGINGFDSFANTLIYYSKEIAE